MDKYSIVLFIASIIIFVLAAKETKRIRTEEMGEKTELIGAYANLIHEIWMQDTVKFKEEIVPLESFQELDKMKEGDWEDIFLEW